LVHPPLHSFPTRRSSDLGRSPSASRREGGWTTARREVPPADIPRWLSPSSPSGRTGTLPLCVRQNTDRPKRRPASGQTPPRRGSDRKSTRLNSSHVKISY